MAETCGETKGNCVCGLLPGHDGPHDRDQVSLNEPSVYCMGQWHDDTSLPHQGVVRMPTGAEPGAEATVDMLMLRLGGHDELRARMRERAVVFGKVVE